MDYSNSKNKDTSRKILFSLIIVQAVIALLSLILFAVGANGILICMNIIFFLIVLGGITYIYLNFYSQETVVKEKSNLLRKAKDTSASVRIQERNVSEAETQINNLKSLLPLDLQRAKNDNRRVIEKFQAELTNNDKDLEKALANTLINNQQAFIQSAMRNARIEDAKIKGIGPKFEEKIKLNGMHTAEDISQPRLQYIKGMNETRVQAVMSWKASVASFANSHKPTSLGKEEIDRLSQPFLTRKQKLQEEITTTEANLPKVLETIQKNSEADLPRREEELARQKTDLSVLRQNKIKIEEQLAPYTNISYWTYLKESLGLVNRTVIIIGVAVFLGLCLQSCMWIWSSNNYLVSLIPTSTPTATLTFTPTNTFTPTFTRTQTSTYTPSVTQTSSITPSSTITLTPTNTLTPSVTSTITSTFPPSGPLIVNFVDVGQGDAILIIAPNGETILIDGGNPDTGIVRFLQASGVQRIDLMIATHPHNDHIGGLVDVLNAMPVGRVITNGQSTTTITYEQFLDAIAASKVEYSEAKRGDRITQGGLTFDVLNPISTEGDINENSLVLRLVYQNVTFLFTGDAGKIAEANMLAAGLPLRANILKVGHHGSTTASSPSFLAKVKPSVAIYFAGSGNPYGHPAGETIQALYDVGAYVYGTDVNGTIIITTDGKDYWIVIEKGNTGTPTAVPTASPTASPTITPPKSSLVLDITDVTSPANAGYYASLSALTSPGAKCTIKVYYKSGPSKAAGLDPTTADDNGDCSWSWKVGINTTPGTWRIEVTASLNGKTITKETTFKVEK